MDDNSTIPSVGFEKQGTNVSYVSPQSGQRPTTRSQTAKNIPGPPVAATDTQGDPKQDKSAESMDAEGSADSSELTPPGPPVCLGRKLHPELARRRLIARVEAGQSINPLEVSTPILDAPPPNDPETATAPKGTQEAQESTPATMVPKNTAEHSGEEVLTQQGEQATGNQKDISAEDDDVATGADTSPMAENVDPAPRKPHEGKSPQEKEKTPDTDGTHDVPMPPATTNDSAEDTAGADKPSATKRSHVEPLPPNTDNPETAAENSP